jgi:hypothetical protein
MTNFSLNTDDYADIESWNVLLELAVIFYDKS